MKPIYIDNSPLMYHRPINRRTMKQHMKHSLQEFKLQQFKKKPVNLIAPSFWVAVGLPVLTMAYA